MFIYLDKVEAQKLDNGVVLKVLGSGERMNVVPWNMADGAIIQQHQHPQEQFGIKGGFEVDIGGEVATLRAGDSYFVPSDTPHSFVAIGETEAVDVFSPQRDVTAGEEQTLAGTSHYT